MSDFNQNQYQANYQQYLESNSDGKIGGSSPQDRINLFKRFLPKGRNVFEIGSAGGVDSLILKEAGYDVTASDYAKNFVKILQAKGLTAIAFDAKTDTLPEEYSAIYANAVFVHFSPNEITQFLLSSKSKLTNEKIIFFSVIKGIGSERSARGRGFERDFYYYKTLDLEQILEKAGLKILFIDDKNEKWIQVIAQS